MARFSMFNPLYVGIVDVTTYTNHGRIQDFLRLGANVMGGAMYSTYQGLHRHHAREGRHKRGASEGIVRLHAKRAPSCERRELARPTGTPYAKEECL